MRRWIALICSAVLVGGILTTPSLTYEARAEATQVSGGDGQNPGQQPPEGTEQIQPGQQPPEGTEQTQPGQQPPEETEQIQPGQQTDAPGQTASLGLDPETSAYVEEARAALRELTEERTVMALVYLSDLYPVRAEASADSGTLVSVPSGQQVKIEDIAVDGEGVLWAGVSVFYQNQEFYGYVPRTYLAVSDEKYLEWEERYGLNPAARSLMALDGQSRSAHPDIDQFPAEYQQALLALKGAHPNWVFVKMNTNLDWNYVVNEEMKGGRSLIPSSFPEYMRNGNYGKGWDYAARGALEYYMDPRNWIAEETVFQFEQLTYNETYHTEAALQNFLNGTFMSGKPPATDITYAKIFWAIGRELGVSPFHLASRVYQEQGQGNSALISGNYPGFQGYYNYFNIGATGTTDQAVITSGLTYAVNEVWNSPYKAIYGGAKFVSKNYILRGQDNVYLQKFDVDNSDGTLFTHQYMQNICAPSSEAKSIRRSYASAGSLENTFVFKIPVYVNMPAACPKPTGSYNVTLTPPGDYRDATIYLDGVAYPARQQGGAFVASLSNAGAQTAVMYKYNDAGVPVGMYVWMLSYNGTGYDAAPVPELENLLSYHGFSIRIVGRPGIRFKTGISSDLRAQLAGGGVAGFTLKEYGTLVMNHANMTQYPMIKGGAKVVGGRSYGLNESGAMEDKIYETVDGRYRYTSVLVGQPVNQYKVEYAFRGYIILSRNGQDITLYGPPVWKSIYNLAKQVLDRNQYPQGSDADLFLRKLISDADGPGSG